jgi:type II secretory pathway predicted ATPase ExeA
VGSGKSTAVAHSLAAVSGKNAIVRVGRYPLQRGEVLDLLFDHMQIRQRPQRSNLKLSLFRQLLFNLAQNDARMFVLVEDAPFLGPEILAELEVMTAADTGASDGANIILMGDESLREFLAFKSLARLRQRVRYRVRIEPCSAGELRGYLTHSMRRAGGDFGTMFAEGADALLHELTGGILRVVNNLVESSLEAAAESGAAQVDLDLITRVANEEFGLTGTFVTPPAMPDTTPEPRHTDESTAELLALSMPDADASEAREEQTAEATPEPAKADVTVADPVAQAIADAVADIAPDVTPDPPKVSQQPEPPADPQQVKSGVDADAVSIGEEEIPELIQDTQPALTALADDKDKCAVPELIHDTLPNLSVLSTELAEQARALDEIDAQPATRPAEAPPPEKPKSKAVLAPAPAAAKPASKKDALSTQAAKQPTPKKNHVPKQVVSKPAPKKDDVPTQAPREPAAKKEAPDEVPAWERDPTFAELRPDLEALERAMAVAQGRDPDAPEEEIPPPPPPEPEAKAEEEPNRKVDRAAMELKKRREEETGVVDESEAPGSEKNDDESRQGQADAELEKIAVGLARAKTLEDVDDQMAETLFGEELSIAAAEVARKVAEEAAAEEAANKETESVQPAANDSRSPEEQEFENVWGQIPDAEVSIETHGEGKPAGLDDSASQRLATVRALNTETAPASAAPGKPVEKPVSIEEQITTSMTQTLEALKLQPAPVNDDDDDEEEKRGFFSRFRRS